MKAPSAGFRINPSIANTRKARNGGWLVVDFGDPNGEPVTRARVVWRGKTFIGARAAHYRLAVARLTGKPVSYAQARRAGNA